MTTRVIASGLIALLLALAAFTYLIHRSVQSRIGLQHVYELAEQPMFLTEDVATAKARETMIKDGLDIASWQEAGSRQIKSNRIVFVYTNNSTSTRFVHVELDGRRVICQISIGK